MKRSFIQTLILLFSLILLSVEAYSAVAPTTQARYIGFTNKTGTSVDVSWYRGNGAKNVLLVKEFTGDTPTDIQFGLINGDNVSYTYTTSGSTTVSNYTWLSSTYTSTFTTSGTTGSNTNFARVVYNGTGNSVRIEGFTPGAKYLFKVLEYNEGGTPATAYKTTTNTANPRFTQFPGSAPTNFSQNATLAPTSASITWQAVANNVNDWGYYLTVQDINGTALTGYDNIDIGKPNDFGTWYYNGTDKYASWEIFDLNHSSTYYALVQGYSGSETTPTSATFAFNTGAPPAVVLTSADIVIDKVNSSEVSQNSKTFTEADAGTNLMKVVVSFANAMDITSTPSITFSTYSGIGIGSNTITGGSFVHNTNYWSADSKTFTQLMTLADQNVSYENLCNVRVTSAVGSGGSVLAAPVASSQSFTIDTKAPNATDYVANAVSVDEYNTSDINVVVKTGYWNASNKELIVGFGNLGADDGSNGTGRFQVQALVLSSSSGTVWTTLNSSNTLTLPAAGSNTSATFNTTTNTEFASFINANNSNTILEFRALVWDINGNYTAQNAYNSTDLIIDLTAPVAYTVTGPVAVGGTVKSTGGFSNGGYFNNTNVTFTLTVNLPNDATLESSTVSFYSASDLRSSTWTNTGLDFAVSHTISSTDLNNAKAISFTKANLASSFVPALSSNEAALKWFKARITEPSGNYREVLFTTRTFTVNLSDPSATTTGAITVNPSPQYELNNHVYWNNQATQVNFPYNLDNDPLFDGGTVELLLVNHLAGNGQNVWYSLTSTPLTNAMRTAGSATFNISRTVLQSYPYYPATASESRTITAYIKVTDITGSSVTYSAFSKSITIDESTPNADAFTVATLGVNNAPPASYSPATVKYWNSGSNLGTVTFDNITDASLIGGTVQLVAIGYKGGTSVSSANIGQPQTITSLTAPTATFSLTEFAQWWNSSNTASFLTANPSSTIGNYSTTVSFIVNVVDAAGNTHNGTGSGSSKKYEVDNAAPVIGTGTELTQAQFDWGLTGTGSYKTTPAYWNKSLHDAGASGTITVTVPTKPWNHATQTNADASILGGTIAILGQNNTAKNYTYLLAQEITTASPSSATTSTSVDNVIKFNATNITGKTFYANEITANFWAYVTDRAGNSTTFTSANTMPIDYVAPTQLTTKERVDIYKGDGTTVEDDDVMPFIKNANQTGVYVYVPVANDNSLVDGKINIIAYKTTAPSATYTMTHDNATNATFTQNTTITSGMLNNTVTGVPVYVKLSNLPITNYAADLVNGVNVNFNAIVTDKAGNSTTFVTNDRQMTLNLSYPSGTVNYVGVQMLGGSNQLNGTPVVTGSSASYSWNASSTSFSIWGQTEGISAGTRTMRLQGSTNGGTSWTTLAEYLTVANGESRTFSQNATQYEAASVFGENNVITYRWTLEETSTGMSNSSTFTPNVYVKQTFTNQTVGNPSISYWKASGNANPTVSIPSTGSYSSATVKGKFDLYANSGATWQQLASNVAMASGYTYTITNLGTYVPTPFGNGSTIKFTAFVTDWAGNSNSFTISSSGILVDQTNPTGSMASFVVFGGNVLDNNTLNNSNESVKFTASASDAGGSSLANFKIYRKSGAGSNTQIDITGATSVTTYTTSQNVVIPKATFETYGAAGTSTTFWVLAEDNAGNTATSTGAGYYVVNRSTTFTPIAPFTTGTVLPNSTTVASQTYNTNGNIYYYNTGHNKALGQITVPISTDNTLTGGYIKYQYKQMAPSTGDWTYATITPSAALADVDLNTSKTYDITGWPTNGYTYIFRALATDSYGNVIYASESSNSITVDQSAPGFTTASQTQPYAMVGSTLPSDATKYVIKPTTTDLWLYFPVNYDATAIGGYFDVYNSADQLIKRFNIDRTGSMTSATYSLSSDGTLSHVYSGSSSSVTTGIYAHTSSNIATLFKISKTYLVNNNLISDAGSYKFYARVFDKAGNITTSTAVGAHTAITVDLAVPPSATITNVTPNANVTSVNGQEYWNLINHNNSNSVTLNVDIPAHGSLVGGTIAIQATTNNGTSWSSSVTKSITATGAQTYYLSRSELATMTGYTGSTASATATFRTYVTSISGSNTSLASTETYTNANSLVIDQVVPSGVTFNTVTPTGGDVKMGFWNNSNTGITFGVTLPNDATLENGSVIIKGTKIAAPYTITNIGANTSITWSNTTLNITHPEATYEAGGWFTNGFATTFTATVSDIAGNSSSFSYVNATYSNRIFNHTTVPGTLDVAVTPTYTVTGGTVQTGYFNATNTTNTLMGKIPLQTTPYGIVDIANSLPGVLHWYAERTSPTAGTIAIGNNTAITVPDVNNNKSAAIDFATFISNNSSSFTEGSIWRFYGIIEDFAGNKSVASANTTTMRYDQTVPSSMTISGLVTGAILSDGSTDNSIWNNSCNSMTVSSTITDPMGIYQYGQNGQFWAQFKTQVGGTWGDWTTPETYTPVTVSGSSATYIVLSGSSLSFNTNTTAAKFRLVGKDPAANIGYGTESSVISIQLTPPSTSATGLVQVFGDPVRPSNWNASTTFGYWNTSNDYLTVTFPIGQSQLVNGRSYLWGKKNAGAWTLLGLENPTSSTITSADFTAGTKTLTVNSASFTSGSNFNVATNDLVTFQVSVVDQNGNSATFTPSSTTISVDLTAPAVIAMDNGSVTGGNVVPNYWNGTNTLLDLPIDYPNDASLNGGSIQFTRYYTLSGSTTSADLGSPISTTFNLNNVSNTFTSGTVLNGLATDGGVMWWGATVTDRAGNSTVCTPSASSYTLDRTAPTVNVTSSNPLYTTLTQPTLTGTISDAVTTDINNTMNIIVNEPDGSSFTQAVTIAPGGNWGVTISAPNALVNGWHSASFTAVDQAGNTTLTTGVTIVRDNVAPVLTINNDANAATTPVLSGTITDMTNTNISLLVTKPGYTRSETFASNYTSNTVRAWSYTWPEQLSPGSYTVTGWATDMLTLTSSAVTATFTIPVVVNVTINAGQQFTTATQNITGTVTAGATVNTNVGAAVVTGTTWTVAATMSDGMNQTVSATATLLGQTATATSTVNVDMTKPLVALTTTNMISKLTNPVITGTASDATSGLSSVNVALTGAGTVNGNATITGGNWTITFNGLAPQGNYNVTVTATDVMGNTEQTTGTLLLDQTGPVLTVGGPTFSQGTTPTIWGTYSDNFDNTPTLSISLNNGGGTYSGAAVTMNSGTWSITTNELTRGTTYTVTPSGTDDAGNTASSVTTGTIEIQAIYTYFTIATMGDEPATISSLANTTPVEVWEVSVTDNANAQDDGLNVNITGIVVTQDATNTAADWTQYINSAVLYVDGTNTVVGTGTINANNITFSGLNYVVTNGSVGYLDLFLTLKTNLPAGADGKMFRFNIANGNVTIAPNTTEAGVFTAASANNMNVIDVTGTTFAFTTQPVNVAAREVAPAVTVSKVDANGNVDKDFTGNVTVNSSATLYAGTTTKTAVLGVATFNDLNYDAPTQVVNLTESSMSIASDNFTVRAARPTTAASSLAYTARSKYSISLSWTNGNGGGRVIVAREANALTASEQPADGSLYTSASKSFTLAQSLGNGKVVFNNMTTTNAETIETLTRLTTYYFAVYEYNTNSAVDAWSASYLITGAPLLNVTTLRKEAGAENTVDGVYLSEIGPNPAYDHINFTLDLVEKSNISIEIRNVAGQLIATPINGIDYNAGSHNVRINMDANTMSSGSYLMTVTVNGSEMIMKRFVVQK